MKSLFASLLVLSLFLVGCDTGPDTGWECPVCGWGCAKDASQCGNKSFCTGYECPECWGMQLIVSMFHDPTIDKRIHAPQKHECPECDYLKLNVKIDGPAYIEKFKAVPR